MDKLRIYVYKLLKYVSTSIHSQYKWQEDRHPMDWSRVQYQHEAEVSKTSRSWTSVANKYEKKLAIKNTKNMSRKLHENRIKRV